jgi:hypothetical protein
MAPHDKQLDGELVERIIGRRWNLPRAILYCVLAMAEPEPPHIAIHWIVNCEWEVSVALPTKMAAGNRPAHQGRLRCHCGTCPSASGGARQAA